MRFDVLYSVSLSFLFLALLRSAFAGDGDTGGSGTLDVNASVTANGSLRVEGTQLVDQSGRPVQLRGMSSHGLRWYPEYSNYGAMATIRQRGANLFRLAMYADKNKGGYNESWEAQVVNKQFVYIGIENALAADMYVIVDWHLLEDKNPLYNADNAEAFFREITSRYPDHPAILYEICNEPNGETNWGDIAEYANRIIPAIRERSPNAVILVGTPQWSGDVLAVREAPLAFPNVMYSYHLYTGNSDYDYVHKLDTMREEGLPVFVTEWGLSTDTALGQLDVAEGSAFIEYMRRHGISWVNWSLSNKDEEFSAIKPDVMTLAGWTDDELTTSGKLIFNALR